MSAMSENGIDVKTIGANSLGQMVYDVNAKPKNGHIIFLVEGRDICVFASDSSVAFAGITISGWMSIENKLRNSIRRCSSACFDFLLSR